MLFGSFRFILGFLPIALAGFYLLGALGRRDLAALWLAAASFAFYGWDEPVRNLAVLGASVALNFAVGRRLSLGPDRRLLALGVGLALAALATFDGSHLDRGSGDAWAEAFFRDAAPVLDRCLAAPAAANAPAAEAAP